MGIGEGDPQARRIDSAGIDQTAIDEAIARDRELFDATFPNIWGFPKSTGSTRKAPTQPANSEPETRP